MLPDKTAVSRCDRIAAEWEEKGQTFDEFGRGILVRYYHEGAGFVPNEHVSYERYCRDAMRAMTDEQFREGLSRAVSQLFPVLFAREFAAASAELEAKILEEVNRLVTEIVDKKLEPVRRAYAELRRMPRRAMAK